MTLVFELEIISAIVAIMFFRAIIDKLSNIQPSKRPEKGHTQRTTDNHQPKVGDYENLIFSPDRGHSAQAVPASMAKVLTDIKMIERHVRNANRSTYRVFPSLTDNERRTKKKTKKVQPPVIPDRRSSLRSSAGESQRRTREYDQKTVTNIITIIEDGAQQHTAASITAIESSHISHATVHHTNQPSESTNLNKDEAQQHSAAPTTTTDLLFHFYNAIFTFKPSVSADLSIHKARQHAAATSITTSKSPFDLQSTTAQSQLYDPANLIELEARQQAAALITSIRSPSIPHPTMSKNQAFDSNDSSNHEARQHAAASTTTITSPSVPHTTMSKNQPFESNDAAASTTTIKSPFDAHTTTSQNQPFDSHDAAASTTTITSPFDAHTTTFKKQHFDSNDAAASTTTIKAPFDAHTTTSQKQHFDSTDLSKNEARQHAAASTNVIESTYNNTTTCHAPAHESNNLSRDESKEHQDKLNTTNSETSTVIVHELDDLKQLRKQQREEFRASEDYLGVTGANPRTGVWDNSEATSSQTDEEKLKHGQQKMRGRRMARWERSENGWVSVTEQEAVKMAETEQLLDFLVATYNITPQQMLPLLEFFKLMMREKKERDVHCQN